MQHSPTPLALDLPDMYQQRRTEAEELGEYLLHFSHLEIRRRILKAKRDYMDMQLKTHLQRGHVAARLLELKQQVQSQFLPFEHKVTDEVYQKNPDGIPPNLSKNIVHYAAAMQKISSSLHEIISEVTQGEAEYKSPMGKKSEDLTKEFLEFWVIRKLQRQKQITGYVAKLEEAEKEFDVFVDESLDLNKKIRERFSAVAAIWSKNHEEFTRAIDAYDHYLQQLNEFYTKKEAKYAADEQKYKRVTARVIKNDNNQVLQDGLVAIKQGIQSYLNVAAPSIWHKSGKSNGKSVPKHPSMSNMLQFLSKFLGLIRWEASVAMEERKQESGDAHTDSEMFEQLYLALEMQVDPKLYNILNSVLPEMHDEIDARHFQTNLKSEENSSFGEIAQKRKKEGEKEEKVDSDEVGVVLRKMKEAEGAVPLKEVLNRLQLFSAYIKKELIKLSSKGALSRAFGNKNQNELLGNLDRIDKKLDELIVSLFMKKEEAEKLEANSKKMRETYSKKKELLDSPPLKLRRKGEMQKLIDKLTPQFTSPPPRTTPAFTTDKPLAALQSAAVAWRRYALTLTGLDEQWQSIVNWLETLDQNIDTQIEKLPAIFGKIPSYDEKKAGPDVAVPESPTEVEQMFAQGTEEDERKQTISSLAELQNVCSRLEFPPAVKLFQLHLTEIMQGWKRTAQQIDRRLTELSAIQKAQQQHPLLVRDVLQEMKRRAKEEITDYQLSEGRSVAMTPLDLLKNALMLWSQRESLQASNGTKTAREIFNHLQELEELEKKPEEKQTEKSEEKSVKDPLVGDLIKYLSTASSKFYAEIVESFKISQRNSNDEFEKLKKGQIREEIKSLITDLSKLIEAKDDTFESETEVNDETIASLSKSVIECCEKFKKDFQGTDIYKNYARGLNELIEFSKKKSQGINFGEIKKHNKKEFNKQILYINEFVKRVTSYCQLNYDNEIINPITSLAELSNKLMEKEYSHILISDDLKMEKPGVPTNSSTIRLSKIKEKMNVYKICFGAGEIDTVDIELTGAEIKFVDDQEKGTAIKLENHLILKQIIYRATSKREALEGKHFNETQSTEGAEYKKLVGYYRSVYRRDTHSDHQLFRLINHLLTAANGMQREVLQLLCSVHEAGGAIGFSGDLYNAILQCQGKSLPEKRFMLRKIVSQQIAEISRIQQGKVNAARQFLSEMFGVAFKANTPGDEVLTQLRVSAKKIDDFSHKLEETEVCGAATAKISQITRIPTPLSYLDYRKTPTELEAVIAERNKIAEKIQATAQTLDIKMTTPPLPSLEGQVTELTTGFNAKIAEKLPQPPRPEIITSTQPVASPLELKSEGVKGSVENERTLAEVVSEMCSSQREPSLSDMGPLLSPIPIPIPEEISRPRPLMPAFNTVKPFSKPRAPASEEKSPPSSSPRPDLIAELKGEIRGISTIIKKTLNIGSTSPTVAPPATIPSTSENAESLLEKMKESLQILKSLQAISKKNKTMPSSAPVDPVILDSQRQVERENALQKKEAEKQLSEYMEKLITFSTEEFKKVWLDDNLDAERSNLKSCLPVEKRSKLIELIGLIEPSSSVSPPTTLPVVDALPTMCSWSLDDEEKFVDGENHIVEDCDYFLRDVGDILNDADYNQRQKDKLQSQAAFKGIAKDEQTEIRLNEEEIRIGEKLKTSMKKLATFTMSGFLQVWSNPIFNSKRNFLQGYLGNAISAQSSMDPIKRTALNFLAETPYHQIDGEAFLQITVPRTFNAIWPVSFIALQKLAKSQELLFNDMKYTELKKHVEETRNSSPEKTKKSAGKNKKARLVSLDDPREPPSTPKNGWGLSTVSLIDTLPSSETQPKTTASSSLFSSMGWQKKEQEAKEKEAKEKAGRNADLEKLKWREASTKGVENCVLKKEAKENGRKKEKSPLSKNTILMQLSQCFKVKIIIKYEGPNFCECKEVTKRSAYKEKIYLYLDSRGDYHPLIPVKMLSGDGMRKILLFKKALDSLITNSTQLIARPRSDVPLSLSRMISMTGGNPLVTTSPTTISTTTSTVSSTVTTTTTSSPKS